MPPLMLFWGFVILLTVISWFPLSRAFFAISASHKERKLARRLDIDEQAAALKHARALAAVTGFGVSWLVVVTAIGTSSGA